MNDTHIENNGTVPDTFTTLSSPHFDELAVAIAQPVQPLPPRWKKRLRSSLFLIAYLTFIVASIGIAYLSPPISRADVSSESMSGETQLDSQPAVDGTSSAATADKSIVTPVSRRVRARRVLRLRFQNQTTEIVEPAQGKPVPRKVGEIRYGRSSDRP